MYYISSKGMPGHDGAPGPQGIPGCNGTKVRFLQTQPHAVCLIIVFKIKRNRLKDVEEEICSFV